MKPVVLGVYHTIHWAGINQFYTYLKGCVKPNHKVAIENPVNLEFLTKQTNILNCPQYRFFYDTCALLENLGAQTKSVEDERAYRLQVKRQDWLKFEGREALINDWIYNKLTVYRSISHLKLASDCNFLITGIFHAYHLEKMGYPAVRLLAEISDSEKRIEDKWIAKYGIDLQKPF